MTPPAAHGPAPQAALGPSGRIESLDAFRGASALAVFLTHWFLWANFSPISGSERLLHDCMDTVYSLFCEITWNSGGQHPAVLAFFVLSGFCIHASRARRAATTVASAEWGRYFVSRARRILPVYWWGTLLGVGLIALQAAWPSRNPMLALHSAGSLRDLLVRVSGLTAIVPGDIVLGNWSLNTVSSEIPLYALYPLLFIGTRRLGWRAMLAALIGLQFVALAFTTYFPPHWLAGTPLMMGAYWYLGMLAAEWHFKSARTLPAWVPVVAWGFFWGLRETPDFPTRFVLLQLVRSAGLAALLLWLVGRETRFPSLVCSAPARFLRWVSQASYSLYAVHPPVIMATTWALGRLLGSRSNSLQLLLTLLATVIGTIATYWLIERPFLRSRPVGPIRDLKPL